MFYQKQKTKTRVRNWLL